MVRRIAESNYFITKILFLIRNYLKQKINILFVVYSAGRVGSMTIVRTLESLNMNVPLYHVHVLKKSNIVNVEKEYWSDWKKLFRHSFMPETRHLFSSMYLSRRVGKKAGKNRWKIISLVQDPIARNVSYFFHSFGLNKRIRYLPEGLYKEVASNRVDKSNLYSIYLEYFHEHSVEYSIPLDWFNFEFKEVLGIDVYSSPFPYEKGYKVYQTLWADVLILKLERLDQCLQDALDEFLGIQGVVCVKENQSSRTHYSKLYKSFIEHANFPTDYVDNIYASQFVTHFYIEEEIRAFKKKWCRIEN